MIYDYRRLISRRLLVWSGLSILVGIYLLVQGAAFWGSFGLQAAIWGGIDAIIAVVGIRGLSARLNQTLDLAQAAVDERKLRRILWINTGLDLIYISGGLALVYILGQNDLTWRGTGWGIAAQGSFLFIFDLLHALAAPREVIMPDLKLFDAPEHQPFLLSGNSGWTAVLVHGFPGTPSEMRDLGHDLHDRGWTVEGLLLPGYGREYPLMFLHRTAGWIEAIAQAVQRHQQAGQKVLLVGFSMGAGLSAPAAALVPPDRLVLLSPFWFDENLFIRGLVWLSRLFLPASIRPFYYLPIAMEMLKAGASKSAPEIDLNNPQTHAFMRNMRLPFIFLEQFREIGFRIKRAYPRKEGQQVPTLVMRGVKDPIVRRRGSQRLAQLTRARFIELPGEHHIYIKADPAYPVALKTILDFATEE